MRRNVTFVIIFGAAILGLIRLHTISVESDKDHAINVNGIVNIVYPPSVEVRNDIPFGLLINPDDKKLIPDSINGESLKPDLILLEKGFDEKDNTQLNAFPSIVVNAVTLESFDASILETDYLGSLINRISQIVEEKAKLTASTVLEWKELPVTKIDGAIALRFEYKLENSTKKILNTHLSYLFKTDKQVEVTLVSPDKNLKEWAEIYNGILNNLSID